MFGNLTLSAIPVNDPIIMGAVGGSILFAAAILALVMLLRGLSEIWIMYDLNGRMM